MTQSDKSSSTSSESFLIIWLGAPTAADDRRVFDEYQAPRKTGDATPAWELREAQVAGALFERRDGEPHALERLFSELCGRPIRINDHYLGFGSLRGKRIATISVMASGVVDLRGQPTEWPPAREICDRAANALALMLQREWVRVDGCWPQGAARNPIVLENPAFSTVIAPSKTARTAHPTSYPYYVVRLTGSAFLIVRPPQAASVEQLRAYAKDYSVLCRRECCLVLARDQAVYFHLDGSEAVSGSIPWGGFCFVKAYTEWLTEIDLARKRTSAG